MGGMAHLMAAVVLIAQVGTTFVPEALAQETPPLEKIGLGVEKYQEGDFTGALQIFQEVIASGEAHGNVLAEAYKYQGFCQYPLGERSETRRSFIEALKYNPAMLLKPEEFNPELVGMFNSMRSEHVTDLEISSNPAKTPVYLDHTRIGETPLVRTNVFRGSYHVRLERPRYRTVEVEVDLRQRNSLFLEMQEECGVRDIWFEGIKGGKPQERVTVRSDALVLKLFYDGCDEAGGRVRRVEFRDLTSGRLKEVFPVLLPNDQGSMEIPVKAPPQGWQPGRFEFRVRAIDAAEEERGAAVQVVIEP